MNKNRELLKEYEGITKEMDIIRNRLVNLKNITENKIQSINSEDERSSIFIDFKTQVDKFKQDKVTKKKYKTLKNRKEQIEKVLSNQYLEQDYQSNENVCNTSSESSEILADIDVLIKKYKKFINVPIEYTAVQPKNKHKLYDSLENNDPSKEKKVDNKHMKKMYNLIESLKMDIDK
jgi:hypothetical protein